MKSDLAVELSKVQWFLVVISESKFLVFSDLKFFTCYLDRKGNFALYEVDRRMWSSVGLNFRILSNFYSRPELRVSCRIKKSKVGVFEKITVAWLRNG